MSLTIHLFIVILDTVKGMLVQLSPAIGGPNVPDIPRDNAIKPKGLDNVSIPNKSHIIDGVSDM